MRIARFRAILALMFVCPSRVRRLAAIVAVALLAGAASVTDVAAQDVFSDFFGGLFGGRHGHHGGPGYSDGPAPRVRRIMPHRENRGPTYWHGQSEKARRGEDQPSADAPAGENAAQPTFFVATIGDSLGLLLGKGLGVAFEEKPEIAILRKTKESSGLVRDDFYDWPKAARELASGAQKIDVAIMMVGSNDRQAIHQGSDTFEPLSPRWREIYAARIDAVIAAFREKNIPLVWVGLPVMKNEHFSAEMAKLNEIYRERAAHAGVTFIDIWEAFADERGLYTAFGPDINGQSVKIRTADGVHFTAAGARNLAHFVESDVKKLFEERRPLASPSEQPNAAVPPAAGASPGEAATQKPGAPVVFTSPVRTPSVDAPILPARPAIGPSQPLGGIAGVATTELAKRAPATPGSDANAAAQALARHVFVEGGDQPARPNRADDFTWRAPASANSPAR